jgi:CheY-like chemotaxis protein
VTAAPGALVVDPDATDRARVAGLLRVTGWTVHEAADGDEALRTARRVGLDLVVSDLAAAPGEGAALLRRLRLAGCRAHLLVVTADPDPQARAAARGAGALACLPKPVDAGLLLRALRARTGPDTAPAGSPTGALGGDDDLDDDLAARLQDLYAGALPGRLTAISEGARSGDPTALATASTTLAGSSAQLGHPEVAAVCRAIARDARRGVLAHHLVAELQGVARPPVADPGPGRDSGDEPVADPADGADLRRGQAGGLQLAPEVGHVRLDEADAARPVGLPDLAQQRLPLEDAPGP